MNNQYTSNQQNFNKSSTISEHIQKYRIQADDLDLLPIAEENVNIPNAVNWNDIKKTQSTQFNYGPDPFINIGQQNKQQVEIIRSANSNKVIRKYYKSYVKNRTIEENNDFSMTD